MVRVGFLCNNSFTYTQKTCFTQCGSDKAKEKIQPLWIAEGTLLWSYFIQVIILLDILELLTLYLIDLVHIAASVVKSPVLALCQSMLDEL